MDSTKADSDNKSYRLIKLPNGLRVLLVHDPPAAQSNGWACLLTFSAVTVFCSQDSTCTAVGSPRVGCG